MCACLSRKKRKKSCLHVLTAKLILKLTHLKLGHMGPSGGVTGASFELLAAVSPLK